MAVAVIVTPPLVEEPDHHVRDEESGEAQQHPQAGRFARGARVRESVQKHIAQQAAGSHRLSQRHELGGPSLPGRVVRKQKQDQVRGQADQARRQQGSDGGVRRTARFRRHDDDPKCAGRTDGPCTASIARRTLRQYDRLF
jgi:hypothetical protein